MSPRRTPRAARPAAARAARAITVSIGTRRSPPRISPDTYAATFEVDPSTTYDAVHTLRPEPDGGFRLETITYGDSPVVVRLRRSNGEDLVLKDGIARGLRRTHAPARDLAPLSEALSYIAEH